MPEPYQPEHIWPLPAPSRHLCRLHSAPRCRCACRTFGMNLCGPSRARLRPCSTARDGRSFDTAIRPSACERRHALVRKMVTAACRLPSPSPPRFSRGDGLLTELCPNLLTDVSIFRSPRGRSLARNGRLEPCLAKAAESTDRCERSPPPRSSKHVGKCLTRTDTASPLSRRAQARHGARRC